MLQHLHHIESKEAPTLVLLHGYGSNMQDLFGLKPYLPPMNLVCFQAPKDIGMGGFAWYDINWDNGTKIIDDGEVASVAKQVVESIADWTQQHELTGPVICGGFSQGAILSMAILRSDFNASGYVLMSGYMLPEWRDDNWKIKVPVLQTHGTMDHVIPFDWAIYGLLSCTFIGISFGSYPAWRAANLDPVDSMRFE